MADTVKERKARLEAKVQLETKGQKTERLKHENNLWQGLKDIRLFALRVHP